MDASNKMPNTCNFLRETKQYLKKSLEETTLNRLINFENLESYESEVKELRQKGELINEELKNAKISLDLTLSIQKIFLTQESILTTKLFYLRDRDYDKICLAAYIGLTAIYAANFFQESSKESLGNPFSLGGCVFLSVTNMAIQYFCRQHPDIFIKEYDQLEDVKKVKSHLTEALKA